MTSHSRKSKDRSEPRPTSELSAVASKLSRIAEFFRADIAIDLGRERTRVFAMGRGVVLNAPSKVTVTDQGVETAILSFGGEARTAQAAKASNVRALHPLRFGVISDFRLTEAMIRHFIEKATKNSTLAEPKIVVCMPLGTTAVERRAIRKAIASVGPSKIRLIE